MTVLCPLHNTNLSTENVVIEIAGEKFIATIGHCPHCKTRYINRKLFPGTSVTIEGKRYEYYPKMATSFPFDASTENILRERENEKKRKEKQAEERRAKYLQLKKSLEDNPKMIIRPAFTEYVSEYPERCPHDETPVVFVRNVRRKGFNEGGYCCLFCSRLFVIKNKTKEKEPGKLSDSDNAKPNKSEMSRPKGQHTEMFNIQLSLNHVNFFNKNSVLPNDTILIASLCCSDSKTKGQIVIVDDAESQDTKHGVYWMGRNLSQKIFLAVQSGIDCPEIKHNEMIYKVESYKFYPKSKMYLESYQAFCNPFFPQTVYVFSPIYISRYESDNYECIAAMIPCANNPIPVMSTVYYDKKSDIYYMNERCYTELRKKNGLPYLGVRIIGDSICTGDYDDFNLESPLHMMGYNVSAAEGMSDKERHELLANIIDSDVLTRSEILSHLDWLISTNYGKSTMENAVKKWRSDRKYVAKHRMDRSRSIYVAVIESNCLGKTLL